MKKQTVSRESLVGATVERLDGDFIYFSNGVVMDVNMFSMHLFQIGEDQDQLSEQKIKRSLRVV